MIARTQCVDLNKQTPAPLLMEGNRAIQFIQYILGGGYAWALIQYVITGAVEPCVDLLALSLAPLPGRGIFLGIRERVFGMCLEIVRGQVLEALLDDAPHCRTKRGVANCLKLLKRLRYLRNIVQQKVRQRALRR